MRVMFVVAATLLVGSAAGAFAQEGIAGPAGSAAPGPAAGGGSAKNRNADSLNPAARGASGINRDAPGTDIRDATGKNRFTGQAVGVPLQPNDLGSPEQRSKE